jgi:hypothetical protein
MISFEQFNCVALKILGRKTTLVTTKFAEEDFTNARNSIRKTILSCQNSIRIKIVMLFR